MFELDITELQYTIAPTKQTNLKFWLGAVLRNNLLRTLADISFDEVSLYKKINTLPLPETNPMYAELCNGFPRGYAIRCEPILEEKTITPTDEIMFRILLFGSFGTYARCFDQAVDKMCGQGLCHPRVPFRILSRGHCRILPLTVLNNTSGKCRITFLTPTMLFNNRAKSAAKQLTCDIQNGIPGFYQLVKSLSNRMNKLQMIYGNGAFKTSQEIRDLVDVARYPLPEEMQLKYTELQGPPKDNGKHIVFSGYTGSIVFSGPVGKYVPLLMTGRYVGAGNETTFGLGHYDISVIG